MVGILIMAYAYTVTGSEDGIVGVYGNRTRAENAAKKYIKSSYGCDREDYIFGSYSIGAQSTVEKFYLG